MFVTQNDNLAGIQAIRDTGQVYDLIEFDGPYMAGIAESWDALSQNEYINHYMQRLRVARDLLTQDGCLFMFGYPESLALLRAKIDDEKLLYLRRWLTWYKARTLHKGRKVETILVYWKDYPSANLVEFGRFLKEKRLEKNLTLRQLGELAGRPWWHRGGNLYFETGSGGFPDYDDLTVLAQILEFRLEDWPGIYTRSYPTITDIDFIQKTYLENTESMGESLRSKPVGLYLDLFGPVSKAQGERFKKALIMYGGSGNAGIAAEALGYQADIFEQDPKRAKFIQSRKGEVVKWREKLSQLSFDSPTYRQIGLFA